MSTPEEIEKNIKAERLAEATSKNLIGQTGKMGIILRAFGQPIMEQYEGLSMYDGTTGVGKSESTLDLDFYNEDTFEDMYSATSNESFMKRMPVIIDDNNPRPTGSEWTNITNDVHISIQPKGYHFDGMSRGMHLEIWYDSENMHFSVYSRGYLVYKEEMGDLITYRPDEYWESQVDKLYKVAKSVDRDKKEDAFVKETQDAEKEQKSWIQSLRDRWGL